MNNFVNENRQADTMKIIISWNNDAGRYYIRAVMYGTNLQDGLTW